jgi:hypothetical protein
MRFASASCKGIFWGLLCTLAVALSAGLLRAQQNATEGSALPLANQTASESTSAAAPALPDAPVVADLATDAKLSTGSALPDAPGFAAQGNAPNAGQSFTLWQRTLLHTMQQGSGERANHYAASSGQSGDLASAFQPGRAPGQASGFGNAGAGMNGQRGPAPGAFKMREGLRSSLDLHKSTQLGSFQATYQNQLGTKSNGLGSASASFNSNAFGNGMFHFSAATMLGSGASHSGKGAGGPMGGAAGGPGGGEKHPGTSLSVKLSF